MSDTSLKTVFTPPPGYPPQPPLAPDKPAGKGDTTVYTPIPPIKGNPQPPSPTDGVHLPIEYMLREYKITKLLGQGGFGVTYLARDTICDRDVVIKENLPMAISGRDMETYHVRPLIKATGPGSYEWALSNFLNEVKILSKLEHPNIIEILAAFQEMGTAYYVMRHISGTSLDKAATPMPEAEIRPLLVTLLNALEYLHSLNLLHRDIKPANILRKPDGSPILIDFGTARILTEHSQTSIESPGYTPIEQIQTHGNLGPWTDLYALGATMYYLITGTKPMKSTDRVGRDDKLVPLAGRPELQKDYSPQLLLSVDKAMALWPEDRWQKASEWKQALDTAPETEPEVIAEPTPQDQEKANAALLKAAGEGKAELVSLLLDRGADIEAKGKYDYTALIVAARFGYTEAVGLLLDRGADIEAKDKYGKTALIQAAEEGETEAVGLLLDRGADIEAKEKYGYTALMISAINGRLRAVKLLLAGGANLRAKNENGETALILAERKGQDQVSDFLRSTGMRMNAELLEAAEQGDVKLASRLLDRGADIEAKDEDGETALIKAARSSKTNVVSLLLVRGADIEAEDKYGYTALIKAARKAKTEVISLLLARGADIEARNKYGSTALKLAIKNNNFEVAKLLISRGAKFSLSDRLKLLFR